MSDIVITGAAGYVGRELVSAFSGAGHNVTAIDRDPAVLQLGTSHAVQADVRDEAAMRAAIPGGSCVIHNAAVVPLAGRRNDYRSVNIDGSKVTARAASQAGAAYFLNISSSALYGIPTSTVNRSTPLAPFEPYGQSKLEGEVAIRAELESRGIPTAFIRPRTIGGGDRGGIFAILFRWIDRGLPIPVAHHGGSRLQLVSVEDLSRLTQRLVTDRLPGVWPAGAPHVRTLREDLGELIERAGSRSYLVDTPHVVFDGLGRLPTVPGVPFRPWHFRGWAVRSFMFDEDWTPPGFTYSDSNFDVLLRAWENRTSITGSGSAHQRNWQTKGLDRLLAATEPLLRQRRIP